MSWLAACLLVLAMGVYKAGSFYSGTSKYIGLQRDAGQFMHALSGAEIIYGGPEVLKFARLLTVRAFKNALDLKLTDAAQAGVLARLDDDQFARLQSYEALDIWLGGYRYRLFQKKKGNTDHIVYFFVPPGKWDNLIAVVPSNLYEKIK